LSANSQELDTLQAIQAPEKLSTCSEPDLILALAVCYNYVGIPKEKYPDDLDGLLLRSFIREHYGSHTLAELKQAFVLLCRGLLGEEPKHYTTFSIKYLGAVMTLYRKYAAQVYKQHEHKYTEPPKTLPATEPNPMEVLRAEYQLYRAGKSLLYVWPLILYETTAKYCSWPTNYFEQFRDKGRAAIEKIQHDLILRQPQRRMELEKKIIWLRNGKFKKDIDLFAKRLAVATWFDNAIKAGKETI
jgi:hypothetical protein